MPLKFFFQFVWFYHAGSCPAIARSNSSEIKNGLAVQHDYLINKLILIETYYSQYNSNNNNNNNSNNILTGNQDCMFTKKNHCLLLLEKSLFS